MRSNNNPSLHPPSLLRQRAVTLMELIASVAIMAILVVGALTLYSSANVGSQTTQVARDLTGLLSATKSLFSGQFDYSTSQLNSTLITAKAIPSSWPVSGSTIKHQLNGSVTITGKGVNGFSVALDTIPQGVCVKLLANVSNAGWDSVVVGTTTISTFPVSPITAATACSGTTNTITFHESP